MSVDILGLDVSFRSTGYIFMDISDNSFVLKDFGVIQTEREKNKKHVYVADQDIESCKQIAVALNDLIRVNDPKLVVVETPTGGSKGARASRCLGLATGTVTTVLQLSKLPVCWLSPNYVRKQIFGRSSVSKEEAQEYVRNKFVRVNWPNKTKFEHIADACVAVLASRQTELFKLTAANREENRGNPQ